MKDSFVDKSLTIDDQVTFSDDRHRYTVEAVSDDGRWIACTRPFRLRQTVLYTVLDTANGLRGTDNYLGSLGYETRDECQEAVMKFACGEATFSRRNPPIPYEITSHVPSAPVTGHIS